MTLQRPVAPEGDHSHMGSRGVPSRDVESGMNFVKTAMLLAALTALFGVVGYALGGESGMLMALGLAAVTNLFAYWNSDRLVLSSHGAVEVDERSAPDLIALVR